MDMQFAKVFSDPDGRDYIVCEGTIIPLAVESVEANNRIVGQIVGSLRNSARGTITLASGGAGETAAA